MTDEERDIMNRLHAEGRGAATISVTERSLTKQKGSQVPTSIYSPREERVKKRPAGPVGSANPAGSTSNPRRSSPPAAPWLQVGFGRFDRLRLLDTALTLEPDESDHSG